MNTLRKILASNAKIKNLLNLVRILHEKYKNRSQEEFVKSA